MRSYSRPLISLSTTLCCEKKNFEETSVAFKEMRNRADTKMSIPVESEFILSQFKYEKSGNVRQHFIHFPINVSLIWSQILNYTAEIHFQRSQSKGDRYFAVLMECEQFGFAFLKSPSININRRDSWSGRASASCAVGQNVRMIDTWPRHTKDVIKMVPVATLLGAQHYKASTGFSSLTNHASLTSHN